MEREELIENEIYYQEYSSTSRYIFKYRPESSKNIGYKCYIWIDGKDFTANSIGCNGDDFSQVRLATPLEKAWLQECIKQGEFVPKDLLNTTRKYNLWKLKLTT